MEFESKCIHSGELNDQNNAHIPPIYSTSTFKFNSAEEGVKAFLGENDNYIYSRWDNPTVNTTAKKIAELEAFNLNDENGNPLQLYGKMFSSGMGAISTLLFSLLKNGDKILTHGTIYGGSAELMDKILPKSGITRKNLELKDLNLVEETIKNDSSIKLLYFETPANPTIDCYNIEGLCSIAKNYNIKVVIDNTFCSPYLQQPFKYGVDFSLHSTTKYLNGHGTAIGGVVIGKDIDFMQNELQTTFKLIGASLSPFDAWLVFNGINTLSLRMEKHSNNALAIAAFLEKHPKVSKVNYLGLDSNPQHELAKKQMKLFGGMISFELTNGFDAGAKMMDNIKFCTLAASLGTLDTLILHPASMSHLGVDKEIREEHGITDSLIRLSVGIENVNDIIEDLEQALNSC
ncbi:MAG: aminotransferase class I/II-fold pyridoxal phosphate-dependent enzyme [Bacteroidia bacterium]|nr:aminotransferase class I/II-fold pyridoxal phosphate-dependent enzyme [Bacteroidia bacterium]